MAQHAFVDAILFSISIVMLIVAAVYFWPLRRHRLRHSNEAHMSYPFAIKRINEIKASEIADPTVKPESRSLLLTHNVVTPKAVVMLHGYTACPNQFKDLAQLFYNHGYNVYVPRTPYHGLVDKKAHAQITASELVDYIDDVISVASGIGDEVGVVGLSGGGVLASWSALYRPDVVRRALILAPFYEPAPSQAAKWKLKPLKVMYGFGLLPDIFDNSGYSYHALAQYLIITRNLIGAPRPNLLTTSLVVADGDTSVDHDQANRFIKLLSDRPTIYTPPVQWGLGHNIVDGAEIGQHAKELYETYLRLYEGTKESSNT